MMMLLQLSSTNPKFRTITFQPGLNIVAGIQLSTSKNHSYNGVGKSFSLTLIHLMFNSDIKTNEQSKDKLMGYLRKYGTFYLDFKVNNHTHRISKNFAESCYYLDDEKIAKTNYPERLRKLIIGKQLPPSISFKNIFNAFARRYGGSYYQEAQTQQGMPITDFFQKATNFYLLGVDTQLVYQKRDVNEQLSKLKKLKAELVKFQHDGQTHNIKDLQEELDRLNEEQQQFIIAENYDKLESQADELTAQVNALREQKQRLLTSLSTKYHALKQTQLVDVDIEKVTAIYQEAQFFFADKVQKRLVDAQQFHQTLMSNRIERFENEITTIKQQIEDIEQQIKPKELDRDSILKNLSSTGALDEYNAITERIKSLQSQLSELNQYNELANKITDEETELDLKKATIKANASRYLRDSKSFIDSIDDKYRALVKRFYDHQGGEIKISQATDAKYLYDLDIHVPKDGSQGINEVKIFCYDFLLHQLNPQLLGFIAHDGCIFSEMDPRQKSLIFKVALEFIQADQFQYFVNIGQASLNEVLDEDNQFNVLTQQEKQQIRQSVVLKLYDKSPTNWLFGEKFG